MVLPFANAMPPQSASSEEVAQGFTLGDPQWLEGAEAGHRIAWWQGGDPKGRPLLLLHGGPGGRTRAEALAPWQGLPVRWIAFDQRGCGASEPLGETRCNTLDALIGDIERLRASLGLEGWPIAGGSWGALLALGYALRHPQRVAGFFLRSPFAGGRGEIERYLEPWLLWLGEAGRAALGDAAQALLRLFQPTTGARQAESGLTPGAEALLADAWSRFDDAQSQPGGVHASGARWSAPATLSEPGPAWRVFRHYAAHGWFLPRPLLDALRETRPSGPLAVVHGALDACCDPDVARALAHWHGAARRIEVPEGGHRMTQPALAAALRAAARDWLLELDQEAALQRSLR